MKINRIECLQLRSQRLKPGDCDGSVDTAVIRVTSDDGVYGIGEADAPPNIMAALLETPTAHIWSVGIRDLLIGQDPLQVEALWDKVYQGTIYHGRRGAGIMLMSAIDIALHDLRGKLLQQPIYKLLGGAVREKVTPYFTLFPAMPQGRSWDDMRSACFRLIEKASEYGARALKMEMLFDSLVSDRELVKFVFDCRKLVGDDREFMIDVGYRWATGNEALAVLQNVEDANLLFVEAPLHTDDLDGLARLAEATRTPVAAGELLQTRHEFRELMERGRCDVIQPDIGRVGGLTEAMRCATMAAERGFYCIPHAWKTGLTVAATRHFGAAAQSAPFVEYYHAETFPSLLRAELAGPEPALRDGRWELPDAPGLGVELNEELVARCLAAPITVID